MPYLWPHLPQFPPPPVGPALPPPPMGPSLLPFPPPALFSSQHLQPQPNQQSLAAAPPLLSHTSAPASATSHAEAASGMACSQALNLGLEVGSRGAGEKEGGGSWVEGSGKEGREQILGVSAGTREASATAAAAVGVGAVKTDAAVGVGAVKTDAAVGVGAVKTDAAVGVGAVKTDAAVAATAGDSSATTATADAAASAASKTSGITASSAIDDHRFPETLGDGDTTLISGNASLTSSSVPHSSAQSLSSRPLLHTHAQHAAPSLQPIPYRGPVLGVPGQHQTGVVVQGSMAGAAAQTMAQSAGVGMVGAGGLPVSLPNVYLSQLGPVPVGMAGGMAGVAASERYGNRFGGGSDQGIGYYQGRPAGPGGNKRRPRQPPRLTRASAGGSGGDGLGGNQQGSVISGNQASLNSPGGLISHQHGYSG
ncbi:unnamed protein product [Closterium sp. NIES-53]